MTEPAYASCGCKVGRSVERYRLRHLDEDLVRRRERDGDSLRDLEAFVNVRVLERAIEDAGAEVAGDARSVYRTLCGDDVSSGRRAEVRRQLANAGVPVSAVEDDFVSHQTVREHLRSCLDVETARRGTTDPDEAAEILAWAIERDTRIIDQTLERLREAGALETGPLDVTHTVRATCERCGASYHVHDLLDRRSCDCEG